MLNKLLTFGLLAAMTTLALGQDSAELLRTTHSVLHRVLTVSERVMKANKHVCKNQRFSYGFTHVSISSEISSEVRALWAAAFGAKEMPTVIYVHPDSSAERAGLQVNDTIISVSGETWPEHIPEQAKFLKALSAAKTNEPSLTITVRRNENDLKIEMAADLTCDINTTLVANNKNSAYAKGRTIYIESGVNQLLSEDGELAFVISHEIAHVILEHDPEKPGTLSREQMEIDADELGIALMISAGYNSNFAASAIRKLDVANRGFITRLFGIHGPYMPTEKRVQHLMRSAFKAKEAKTLPEETTKQ